METLILVALAILALTIVVLRIRQSITGLSQKCEGNNCAGCGNCCSSLGDYKED